MKSSNQKQYNKMSTISINQKQHTKMIMKLTNKKLDNKMSLIETSLNFILFSRYWPGIYCSASCHHQLPTFNSLVSPLLPHDHTDGNEFNPRHDRGRCHGDNR